ncbi:hypothetical protein PTSG_01789 [Salpingoeca rosetta]|uniref:Uncharacterized protein n=1 Tax=Salpingoeca rosetta (strain ATCC 50818 / BSB-021) TaxID=946362 RepID=F2TYZ0_SALR5|nr:uncharacterized protein PTSG_01789 [Salpingoeca rosetta]EGD78814.1 hypothetical protein PTSG_01789 [Salpingoeca rosetta]|eukprot:XP_004997770.1 hypothetical protein PTSG_01789 [Salpingoeca rosetta]
MTRMTTAQKQRSAARMSSGTFFVLLVVVSVGALLHGAVGAADDAEARQLVDEFQNIEPLTAALRSVEVGALTMPGFKHNKRMVPHVASLCGFNSKEIGRLREVTAIYAAAVKDLDAGNAASEPKARAAFDGIMAILNAGPASVESKQYASNALNYLLLLAHKHGYTGQRLQQLHRELNRYDDVIVNFYRNAHVKDITLGTATEAEVNAHQAAKLKHVGGILKRIQALQSRIVGSNDEL